MTFGSDDANLLLNPRVCGTLLFMAFSAAASPASSWTVHPVGDSVTLMESGDDYHVEIGCQRPSGSKLRFEVHRFFPPVEELTKIRSVQVMLEQGQEATFSETIDVTLSDERDVKVVGEVNFSPDDIETLVKASRMTISDNATGKILFRSQMQGILGGRDLLRERCGI